MWLLLSLLISLQYSRYCSSMLIAILSLIHANDVDLAPVGLVAAVIITLGLSTSTLREQKVDWSGALSCRLGERTVPEAGQLLNFCGLRVFQINKKKKNCEPYAFGWNFATWPKSSSSAFKKLSWQSTGSQIQNKLSCRRRWKATALKRRIHQLLLTPQRMCKSRVPSGRLN